MTEEWIYISDPSGRRLDVQITAISPRPRARMIQHPVESGGVVFDNKVLEPITLDVTCFVPDDDNRKETVERLYSLWEDRSYRFCIIAAVDNVYENMALVSMPHSETAERFDALEYRLTFQQVVFGQPNPPVPSDPANAPTSR